MSDLADPRPALTAHPATLAGGHDLAARDGSEGVVRVSVDPDLDGVDHGGIAREDGDDAERHARRAAALDRLFASGR